ncbi:MAG: glutamate synthase subunit beta [Oscillospiraceae bacterium]|nr:glutamate synthase subunit beta [Oscillospiraceae bacterium]
MAKPDGFMLYPRSLPKDRSPEERLLDYGEFHRNFSDEKQRRQAARCMDCGIPFCHTGIMLGGATSGCPLNNLIPEWNELVYRGRWKEAYERLSKTNNFPEFTGSVCPAPCEDACTVGIYDPMVTIKQNEHHIIEKAFEAGWVTPYIPETRSDKRVAVIGSGPAGLACADELNRAGHHVVVYEKSDRPGGLLMYGIPNMKLEKNVVLRRIALMEQSGIRFVTGVAAGIDIPIETLLSENDAVVFCCGAGKPRDLPVPGCELSGIYFAMDFLSANTRALLAAGSPADAIDAGSAPSAKGKNVIIIGGGDTGTDCVATCLRHGAKSVRQLEILPEPPAERCTENPWPQWRRILRTDYGHEEAIFRFGEDPRVWETTAISFSGNKGGRVTGILTAKVEWERGEDGRMRPKPIPGTEKEMKADMVLLAMGFLGPEDTVFENTGLVRDGRGNIDTREGTYATEIPGVFAAGDARRGQSLVVWAIHEGRAAARACDCYLAGQSFLPG